MTDKVKDAFKKLLNKINNSNNMNKIVSSCSGSSCGGCGGHHSCDEDPSCKDCSCDKDKPKAKKANSETLRDDGCFCRKCNVFMPMAEPDDKKDGKRLCYSCANPWWK